MNSIRARLILGVLLGATVFLAASGAMIYFSVHRRMYAEQDRALLALVQANAPTLLHELGRLAPDRERPGDPRLPRLDPPFLVPFHRMDTVFQCWREGGEVLDRSESLGTDSLPRLARDLPVLSLDSLETAHMRFRSLTLPDGSPARAVGLRFRPELPPAAPGRTTRRPGEGERPPVEIVFAQTTEGLRASLAYLRWLLLLTWFATSVGSALILSMVIHRSLHPLRALSRGIEDLDEQSLDQRFPSKAAPRELLPVIDQLNELLGRIADAFAREQAFTAHAAHELRTPLAGLRSTLEVSLTRPREGAEYRTAEEQCLEITLAMESMVEGLLELARSTKERPTDQDAPVSLAGLATEAWALHAEEAARRGLRFDGDVDPGLVVHTDARLLRRVFDNLLGNCVAYADEGGTVRLEAHAVEGGVEVHLDNPASHAPPEVARRAFDAFWRADPSRSDTGRHAGLGLSLSRRIMDLLGGTIVARYEDGRFALRLRLPSAA